MDGQASVDVVIDGAVAFVDGPDADDDVLASAIGAAVDALTPGEAVLTVYGRRGAADGVVSAGAELGFELLDTFAHPARGGETVVLRRLP